MTTRFYYGNYLLDAGLPYVIISVNRRKEDYLIQVFIVFRGFDDVTRFQGRNYSYPITENLIKDDIFANAVEIAKEFILDFIILKYYANRFQNTGVPPIILRKTTQNMLVVMVKNHWEQIRLIRKHTVSQELISKIDLYRGVHFKIIEEMGDD